MMENIEQRLNEILISFGIDQKKLSKHSDYYFDLNLDILDLMTLAGNIRNEFSVNIPDNEIYKMEKISDTIHYIEKKTILLSGF